jgi:hypothetical protein
MNYRRKKISMKELLEAAIEAIGSQLPRGAGVEREAPEERLREIELAAPGLRPPHGQSQPSERHRPCLR